VIVGAGDAPAADEMQGAAVADADAGADADAPPARPRVVEPSLPAVAMQDDDSSPPGATSAGPGVVISNRLLADGRTH
jgi:hypothetical protein